VISPFPADCFPHFKRISGYTAGFFPKIFMDEQSSLLALFTSSFLGATLLPGGSEAVLFAVLSAYPQLYWPALLVASVGNTLGGMSSYAIGRFLPHEKALMQRLKGNMRGVLWVRKHGSPILLLSWVPLIGDLLCVAAGWLRINWISAMAFMAAGKFMRYWAIAAAMSP
jgi:membrane protein YqaA with SNARE-associated domain